MGKGKLLSSSALLGVAACATLLVGLSRTAAGQEPTVAATSQESLEEITVTAERVAEDVQKTPMNVTVISGQDIEKEGRNDMQEILGSLPGVTIQSQVRGLDATVRGLGLDLPPGSAEGPVAVEQDGVYDGRAEAGRLGYYDLQRIEVLAGPQGTLYGVNADGGVININTNKPVLGKFDMSGQLQTGNYNLLRGEGMLNLPMGDTAALRVAFTGINRDGYLDTGADDAVGQGGRLKYLWKPNDAFSILLGYEVAKLGGKGTGTVEGYLNGSSSTPYSPVTNGFISIKSPWTDAAGPEYGFAAGAPGSDTTQWDNFHQDKYWAEANWDLGFANISFLPSYTRAFDTDDACGMGPVCTYGGDPAKLEQNTEELRITSPTSQAWQWAVGAYHWGYLQYTFGGGPSGTVYDTSTGVFGETTIPVATSTRLKIGGRENWDWKAQSVSAGSLTFTHFDYRVGLEHDLTPQNMIYATVATGYRPGGFNLGAGTFKSETVTDFELGSKNKFLNDRVIMNVDGFFYNYKNFQLLDFYGAATSSCAPGPPVFPPTYNLDARNFGADFTLAALATNQDTVNVALEYLHSRFTSSALISYNPIDNCRLFDLGLDPTEANTVDSFELSDAVEPHSPTISGNLSWEHRFGLPGGGTLAARPAMYFSSAYFVHPEEFAESNQPAYSTYEFTLTYSPSDGKYSVAAWGRNLGDYAVKEALVPVTIGPPRTYGVTISAHL